MTLFRRRRQDADLEAEIQAHLAIAIEERVERGEPLAEATANARREFGNIALVQEVTRSMWGWNRLERIVDGARHAVRYNLASFRREPVSSLVMVLTLALILGGNITMFSSANAAILRNRPGARHPERLVDFVHAVPAWMSAGEFSQRAYLDYRERLTTLAGPAAYSTFDRTTLRTPDGVVDAARTASVSGNYFAVLEVTPASGRFFTLDDDRATAEPTAVIAHRLWLERFAGAPSAIGSSIMVNGSPFTVIGVAPKDFLGTSVWKDDIWIPLAKDPKTELYRAAPYDWLGLVGRLKPGVSVETAQASIDVVTQNLERGSRPAGNVRILNRWYQGTEESTIAGLTALSVVGLLVACVNVASIGLSRALTRSPEIVVRLALGAPRRAIVGQLLAETLVFFLPAVPIGAVLATWFVTDQRYIDLDLRPDWRVLVFTLGVVFVAAIVAGLTPALQAISTRLTGGLKESSWGSGRRRQRLHHALIPVQVAASVALLAVGGLYYRTLHHLASIQGFDATGLHAAMLDFSISGLKPEEGRLLTRQLVPLMNGLPDVESASLAQGIPGTGTLYRRTGLWKPGQALDPRKPAMYAPLNIVAPGFLETMGIKVVRGRDFSDADREGTRQVALVSQGLARQLGFADAAVGQTLYTCAAAKCAAEIVGVVADSSALVSTEPVVYRPLEQQYSSDVYLVFRSTNPGGVISSTRQALRQLNPNVPILETLSVADGMRDAAFYQYIGFWSMAPLGLVTLVMAALGIYGVASYAVSSRMREIGIRTALGARPGRVIGGLIRHPLAMAAIGLAAGCAGGILVAGSIPKEPGFYGVRYFDPATYACASLVVLAIVFLAGFLPARRAVASDPMLVLRHE